MTALHPRTARRRLAGSSLLLLLLAAASAPPAPSQGGDADMRCVLAGNFYGAVEKDPARKQLALATALFFSGRVDALIPPARLRAVIAAEGRAVTANSAPAVMIACARSFQAKERALRAVGQEVARSQPAAPAKKSN